MSQQISISEVKKHDKSNSVWIVIHDVVYDVTSFLSEHPGGADALLDVAGTECTQAFEDVGHSSDARDMLKKYKIGQVPRVERKEGSSPCQSPCCTSVCKSKASNASSNKSKTSLKECDKSKTSLTRPAADICKKSSCLRLPKPEKKDKTWRTFDCEDVDSRTSECVKEKKPRKLIISRNRRPERPCPDNRLKYALLALGAALIVGFVVKKFVLTS